MKLYCNPIVPSTRSILVTAMEAGLEDELDIVRTGGTDVEASEAARAAGVVQEPRLALDDGTVIVGAQQICACLDSLHERPGMIPGAGEARLEIDQLESAAEELFEAALYRYQALHWPDTGDNVASAQWQRMQQIIETLESVAGTVMTGPVNLGQIAVACTLGWLDKYLPDDDWRSRSPALARWYRRFRDRPSMRATEQ
ncbi:MAG: glutathione S-transferase C-terminal domain-containing protein [Alphaproteobacteria bacterium]